MEEPRALVETSWRYRRIVVFGTLLFCYSLIVFLAVVEQSTPLRESIANGLLLLSGTVIGAYIGGAVWDDRNKMKLS